MLVGLTRDGEIGPDSRRRGKRARGGTGKIGDRVALPGAAAKPLLNSAVRFPASVVLPVTVNLGAAVLLAAAATGKSRTGGAEDVALWVKLPLTVKLPPTESVPVLVRFPVVANEAPLNTSNVPLFVASGAIAGNCAPRPCKITVPLFVVTEVGTSVFSVAPASTVYPAPAGIALPESRLTDG